jgi:lactobin A/cerein 7B family class IIb bacteriocin
MNKESTMNEVCCIYELSEEQLDEVNGGILGTIAAGVAIIGAAYVFGYAIGHRI